MAESVKVATEAGAKVTTTVTAEAEATAEAPAEPGTVAVEVPVSPRLDQIARVSQIMGAVTNQAYHSFVVGLDGSANSEIALSACLCLMGPKDHISLLHFYDSTKNIGTFDPKYGQGPLREKYETRLATQMSNKRYQLLWQDKNGARTGDTVARYLNTLAAGGDYRQSRKAPEFAVFGFRGRKAVTEVGSVADLAMRRLHLPCILVKDNYAPKPGLAPRTFVACVKDDKSDIPYEVCCSLMKPKDRLRVLCIVSSDTDVGDYVARIKAHYEDDMMARGLLDAKMDAVPDVPGQTVVDRIDSYACELEADYVVVVPSANATVLSSNCEALIRKAKFNIILCKK